MFLSNFKEILRGYKTYIFILLIPVVLLLFLYVFNWNWLKPFVISYVSQKSERLVKIGKLDVKFSGLLNPTLKFDELYISNAQWSNKRPLISAKKISFKFNAIQFLLNPEARNVHVTMSDSEVNLERLRDGLRNWRLLKPNYKGVGKYVVLSLSAENSEISFNNHALQLNITAKSSPNLTSTQLPNKIKFSGSYLKGPFDGVVLTSSKVTFQKTNELFDMNGYANQGKNKINIVGKVGDVYRDALIDAEVGVTGNIFSLVNNLGNESLVGKNSFNLSTHLHKLKNNYKFENFHGKINGSDLKGYLLYVDDSEAPQALGNFTSKEINFKSMADLYAQLDKSKFKPGYPFPIIGHLKKTHLNLMVNIDHIVNIKHMDIRNLKVAVNGSNEEFDINIETDQLNGGKLSANVTIKPANKPAQDLSAVHMDVIVKKLKLASLLNNSELDNKVSAPVDIKIQGDSVGNSFREFISNASGKADITLGKGMISNKLDAKLGLDFGKVFWLSFREDKNITLNCGKISFNIKKGFANSRSLFIDTSQTTINGQSDFDFGNKRLNVLLDPAPKNPTLFAKNESIKLTGYLDGANYKFKTSTTKFKNPQNLILQSCNTH